MTLIQLSGEKGQIINLGAGFDTLYWRLKESGKSPTNFIELDFPSITARKCYHIKKHKQLIDMLNTEGEASGLTSFLVALKIRCLICYHLSCRRRDQVFNDRPPRGELPFDGNGSETHI